MVIDLGEMPHPRPVPVTRAERFWVAASEVAAAATILFSGGLALVLGLFAVLR